MREGARDYCDRQQCATGCPDFDFQRRQASKWLLVRLLDQGNRWRHQIAVAPFGPHGEIELVDVLRARIWGGVVDTIRERLNCRFCPNIWLYLPCDGKPVSLDMAAAGDFDGDGHVDFLLPNQVRGFGAIRRTADGALGAGAKVGLVTDIGPSQMTTNWERSHYRMTAIGHWHRSGKWYTAPRWE